MIFASRGSPTAASRVTAGGGLRRHHRGNGESARQACSIITMRRSKMDDQYSFRLYCLGKEAYPQVARWMLLRDFFEAWIRLSSPLCSSSTMKSAATGSVPGAPAPFYSVGSRQREGGVARA